jgi:hypothetical protein
MPAIVNCPSLPTVPLLPVERPIVVIPTTSPTSYPLPPEVTVQAPT